MSKNNECNCRNLTGYCSEGHTPKCRNVYKSEYAFCEECKIFWLYGINTMTGWRNETEEIWERNKEFLSQFKQIADGGSKEHHKDCPSYKWLERKLEGMSKEELEELGRFLENEVC